MHKQNYPEIDKLKEIRDRYTIKTEQIKEKYLGDNKDYPQIKLSLSNHDFNLYVDDEYQDLKLDQPLLSICLVLRELENYAYADDYLVWCTHHAFDSSNTQIRNYHMSLGKIYREIELIIGNIKSFISAYDFELNAGAARHLREVNI